jgi:hypothetical protein
MGSACTYELPRNHCDTLRGSVGIHGIPRKMIVQKELDCVGPKLFDVNRGLNLMYVYCDVASHGIVGDTKLRVFNPVGRHGDLVRLTYDRIHYVPIGRREFDGIAITCQRGSARQCSKSHMHFKGKSSFLAPI